MLHALVLTIIMQKKHVLLQIWALYQWGAQTGWLMTYFTLLPHVLAQFMTSLVETAGHKMAAHTVVAMRLLCRPMRSQNRWARDIFHIFATHAGPVYDITDIDCWSQNRCTDSHNYVTSLPMRSQNRLAHDISHFCHSCWPSLWHHWYRRLVTKSLHTQSYLCDFQSLDF